MGTRSVKIGKLTFELDQTAADAVDAEREERVRLAADAEGAMGLAKEAEQRAVAAEAANREHLSRIEALDAELKKLRETPPAPKPEEIERLAEERATVVADAAVLAPDLQPTGKSVDQIRREALVAGAAKEQKIKTILDAALTGTEMEKTSAEVVKSIFAAAVGVARTSKTAGDDGLAHDLLTAGGGKRSKDKNAQDKSTTASDSASELSGYELYRFKMTHPKARA